MWRPGIECKCQATQLSPGFLAVRPAHQSSSLLSHMAPKEKGKKEDELYGILQHKTDQIGYVIALYCAIIK